MSRKDGNESRFWSVAIVVFIALPIFAYLYVDYLYGGKSEYNQDRGSAAILVMTLGFASLAALGFASTRVGGKHKKVVLIGVVTSLFVIAVSYITKWLAG